MSAGPRRRLAVVVAALAVAGIAAACAPVTPPAPPPTSSPPVSVAAACPGLEVPTPSEADPVDYVAVVEEPSGETEFESFTATSEEQVEQEIAALQTEGEVVTVTEDLPVSAQAVNPHDDDWYVHQWGLPAAGFESAWALPAGRDGAGQTIAIVDTGIDTDHPEFAGRIDPGARFIADNESDVPDSADVEDDYGHGTHVAGIAAAADSPAGPTSYGVGGAPAARILPVKVLDNVGKGSTENVADGIKWAGERANVINLSLGGGSCEAIGHAVEEARADGAVVVAAAGNSGTNKLLTAPGGLANVITVGATNSSNTRPTWSNYGPYVELGAPGSNIYSTVPPTVPLVAPTGKSIDLKSGTSMATPFVSAAVALLRQQCPGQSVDWYAQRLRQTATPMIPSLGAPLLNVHNALQTPC
jgi:thermitase